MVENLAADSAATCRHSEKLALFILALFLQGMVLWQFFDLGFLAGVRGPIMGTLVLSSSLWIAIQHRSEPTPEAVSMILSMLASACYLLVVLFSSEPLTYSTWKVQGYILYALLPAAIILWNYSGRIQCIAFLCKWILVFAALPLLLPLVIRSYLGTGPLRWLLIKMDYDIIGLSRILGLGTLIAFTMGADNGKWKRFGLYTYGLLLLGGQVVIGERGPVLALIVSLMVFGFLRWSRMSNFETLQMRRLWWVAMLVVLSTGAFSYIVFLRGDPMQHEKRILYAQKGWEYFCDNPWFGMGIGRFSSELEVYGGRQYFHNIIGEITVETGLLGLVFFLSYFMLPWLFLPKHGPRLNGAAGRWREICAAMFAFALTSAMVSGDLTTNYLVWSTYALLICTCRGSEEGVATCASSS